MRKKIMSYPLIINLLTLIFLSCAARKKIDVSLDCSQRVAKIIELYNSKKYSFALSRIEDAKMQCSGTELMDTILYYSGMINIKTKKYLEAQTEFQKLVQDFPTSPFSIEAKFRIAYAVFKQSASPHHDQKETKEAIRLFDNFIDLYPNTPFTDSAIYYRTEAYEKLALKEFRNAQFYEKINEPEAAVIYYKVFLSQFADSRLVDKARYNAFLLLVKLNRFTEAKELYTELIERGKDKELIKEATAIYNAKLKDSKPVN
ncbi:MAG: outer membrane protein assembly factor BamD [Chitinispirillaceae bacterium]|nr:outer membrane protein assembly factor BamD [Chitinispirillaceae bacterium]